MKKTALLVNMLLLMTIVAAQTPLQRTQMEKINKTAILLDRDTGSNGRQVTSLHYHIQNKKLTIYDVYYEFRADSLRIDFITEKNLPLSSILNLKLKDVTNPADEDGPVYECTLKLKPGTRFTEKIYTKNGLLTYTRKELKLYFNWTRDSALAFIRDIKKQGNIK